MTSVLRGTSSSICRSCLRLLRAPPMPRLGQVSLQRLSFHTISRRQDGANPMASPSDADPSESFPKIFRPMTNLPSKRSALRLSPEDLNRLEKTLDAMDLPGAYAAFDDMAKPPEGRDAPTPGGTTAFVSDEAIKPAVELLLEGLIAEGNKHPELPSPRDFVERLRVLGVASDSQYRLLLTSMLQQGKSPEEVAPVLDSAIEYYKEDRPTLGTRKPSATGGVKGEGEEEGEGEGDAAEREHHILWSSLRPGFREAHNPTAVASTIYLSFLHTADVGGELHQKLEKVLFAFFEIPNIVFLERYMNHHSFDPEVRARLLQFAKRFELRKLLTVPLLLTRVVARSTDSESLKSCYESLRGEVDKAGIQFSEENYMVFVMGFMALGDTEAAIEVWNEMASSGIFPGPRAWNKLLSECAKFRDSCRLVLYRIWKKMISGGVVPDAILWTTRIHSLLLSGHLKEGMHSLNAMQEAKIKPTTETINAVLDGLLRHRHLPEALSVLKTSAKMKIGWDVTTYNTLLRGLLRMRKLRDALSLLRKMEQAGVDADVVTATIVLNGIYKDFAEKPDFEQIKTLLDYMEDAGVPANEHTYSSIIDGLLVTGTEGAAQDIWKIMEQKGIKPSVATYTSVIKYAFQKGDLEGVERLRAQLQENGIIPDQRLWMTLSIGFTRAGEISAMRDVLAAMAAKERTLPLAGYSAILRELDAQKIYEVARELVEEVISLDMVSRDGTATGPAERIFWETLERMGDGSVVAELRASGTIVNNTQYTAE